MTSKEKRIMAQYEKKLEKQPTDGLMILKSERTRWKNEINRR